ncbi:flavin reductase family protein [Kitasatospora sp. NPDC057223]|uniref:flavin reductase family protein n=1 Tax=Kitasatospora sp. NPDC057223 TaxID=3346055 RepID=UPI0036426CC9
MTITTDTPADLLRRTLRRHAAGVTILTVPGPAGFTATSFTSVSLQPALVSFYLAATASTSAAVHSAEMFAAHILGEHQSGLARRFATSGIDRFADTDWAPDADGLPILGGVPARLTARIVDRRPVGDHLLVVGAVESAVTPTLTPPLLHFDGGFGSFTGG